MSSGTDSRATVEGTVRWEQALAAAWQAIQRAHPELAKLDLNAARQATPACPDTDTAPAGAAVRTAIEQAASIEDLDEATTAGLTGQVALIGLLHLAAHALAVQRGRQDTSNRGYYHNRAFVALAAEVGLDADDDGRPGGRGWHHTSFGARTSLRYEPEIEALAAAAPARPVRPPRGGAGSAPTGRGYVAATCRCTPARRIRVSRTELDRGGLACRLCGGEFTTPTSTA